MRDKDTNLYPTTVRRALARRQRMNSTQHVQVMMRIIMGILAPSGCGFGDGRGSVLQGHSGLVRTSKHHQHLPRPPGAIAMLSVGRRLR